MKTLTIHGKTVVVPGEEDAEPSPGNRREQRKADHKAKKSKQ